MSTFVNTIDVLGDDAVIDSILTGSITEFKDDVVERLGRHAFGVCGKLTLVDVPNVMSIGRDAFVSTPIVALLLRRNDTVCTLYNSAVFNSSGVAKGTGYIYVPRALIDSYKAATNWSTYANQFRALEDYTVDGTITGALDESKI